VWDISAGRELPTETTVESESLFERVAWRDEVPPSYPFKQALRHTESTISDYLSRQPFGLPIFYVVFSTTIAGLANVQTELPRDD
jgi:hypothetical protein